MLLCFGLLALILSSTCGNNSKIDCDKAGNDGARVVGEQKTPNSKQKKKNLFLCSFILCIVVCSSIKHDDLSFSELNKQREIGKSKTQV